MKNIEQRSSGIIKPLHSLTDEMRRVQSRFWLPIEIILKDGMDKRKGLRKIGREIDKDHSTVRNWSVALGIEITPPDFSSEEERKKVKELIDEGHSYRRIGRELTRTHKVAKSIAVELGTEKKIKLPSEIEKPFSQGIAEGASYREIGRRTKMGGDRVKRWIRKYKKEKKYQAARNARKK